MAQEDSGLTETFRRLPVGGCARAPWGGEPEFPARGRRHFPSEPWGKIGVDSGSDLPKEYAMGMCYTEAAKS